MKTKISVISVISVILMVLAFSTLNAQWQKVNGLPYNKRIWYLYTRGDSLYVCNDSGLYVSPNAGQTWVKKTDIVFSAIASRGYLIAGGTYGIQKGLWKSLDGGTSWTQVGSLTDRLIISIKCGSYYTYICTDNGLYRVSGDNLNVCYNSFPNIFTDDVMIKNDSIIYLLGGKIYRSTNYGISWVSVKDTAGFSCIATDGFNIYAGAWGEIYVRGVWKSSNNGNTWTRIGLSDKDVWSLAVINNYVVAGTDVGYSGMEGGVYVYNGVTWFNRSQGLPVNSSINKLAICNNYIYCGNVVLEYALWKRSISEVIGVKKISSEIPVKFDLNQNYPNPFNPSTIIRYQIPKEQFVSLKVFDITGKEIETLVNEKQSPGTYEVKWDASNYSSGVYFYRLNDVTKECVLIK